MSLVQNLRPLLWVCSSVFSLSQLLMSLSGNLKELYQGQAAEADFKWQAKYGNVIRFKSVFGVCNNISTCDIHFLIC